MITYTIFSLTILKADGIFGETSLILLILGCRNISEVTWIYKEHFLKSGEVIYKMIVICCSACLKVVVVSFIFYRKIK